MLIERIISGGQTGVDRAALDVAIELGISCGGWCPRGRRAEDGVIPARYPLQETDSIRYPVRTALNVRDSDGTLIITRGKPDRGTALTRELARRYQKPCRVVDLEISQDDSDIRHWLQENSIRTLNVAGPRASSCSGIDDESRFLLRRLLEK